VNVIVKEFLNLINEVFINRFIIYLIYQVIDLSSTHINDKSNYYLEFQNNFKTHFNFL